MNEYIPHIPAKYVMPLNMNGMNGRMLYMSPPKNKKRNILVVYGHHASLERMYSLAQVMNHYGSVTMPDLPGFGGMDSFYKIGSKPSLDNLADYLASFIKLRFKQKQLTIVGFSFGFLVVTRMLQKYPDIVKKTDMVVSCVGFAHHEDFAYSKTRFNFYRWTGSLISNYLPSLFFRYVAMNPFFLKTVYSRTHNAKHKYGELTPEQQKAMTEFEIRLWHMNDARTYGDTVVSMFTANNCTRQINLPVWHVRVKNDNYFNQDYVEQHMRIIFSEFHACEANLNKHTTNIISSEKDAAAFLPAKLKRELNKRLT